MLSNCFIKGYHQDTARTQNTISCDCEGNFGGYECPLLMNSGNANCSWCPVGKEILKNASARYKTTLKYPTN